MKISLAIMALLTLSGCTKPHCPESVQCSMGVDFFSVGYTPAELDSVIFVVFPPGNTFSDPIDTIIALDTFVENSWVGPVYVWDKNRANGNGDTLVCTYTIPESLEYYLNDSGIHDWEIMIPSVNKTYRFSKITYGGSENQTLAGCDANGSPVSPSCNRYISSYELNGTTISFSGKTDPEVLYIIK